MKKAELRKLIAQYRDLKLKHVGDSKRSKRLSEKLEEIRHRYFHETGRDLESVLKESS